MFAFGAGMTRSNSIKMGRLNKTQTCMYDNTTDAVINYQTFDMKPKYKQVLIYYVTATVRCYST